MENKELAQLKELKKEIDSLIMNYDAIAKEFYSALDNQENANRKDMKYESEISTAEDLIYLFKKKKLDKLYIINTIVISGIMLIILLTNYNTRFVDVSLIEKIISNVGLTVCSICSGCAGAAGVTLFINEYLEKKINPYLMKKYPEYKEMVENLKDLKKARKEHQKIFSAIKDNCYNLECEFHKQEEQLRIKKDDFYKLASSSLDNQEDIIEDKEEEIEENRGYSRTKRKDSK